MTFASRFRRLLPVVIDVETSGLNSATDALLEIAAVTLKMDAHDMLSLDQTYHYHVEPFAGANLDAEALAITGIDPYGPLRYAIPEQQALHRLFTHVKRDVKIKQCQRAVLVGHNAWFDLAFLQAAVKRCKITDAPFHSFTTLDTATLAALSLGETVLAKATKRAGIPFDIHQAHSAIYDATRTAELFCYIANHWKMVW